MTDVDKCPIGRCRRVLKDNKLVCNKEFDQTYECLLDPTDIWHDNDTIIVNINNINSNLERRETFHGTFWQYRLRKGDIYVPKTQTLFFNNNNN
jgi:hypothetical protein